MALTDRQIAFGWGALLIALGFGMIAAALVASESAFQAAITTASGLAFIGAGFAAVLTGIATRRHAEFVIVVVSLYFTLTYLV